MASATRPARPRTRPPPPPPALAVGDLIALPWGGLTAFDGRPCGDCGDCWTFEVVKVWRLRRWVTTGPETWRGEVSIHCPTCMAYDPRRRGHEKRQHMGWHDLRTGAITLEPKALELAPPCGVTEGGTACEMPTGRT